MLSSGREANEDFGTKLLVCSVMDKHSTNGSHRWKQMEEIYSALHEQYSGQNLPNRETYRCDQDSLHQLCTLQLCELQLSFFVIWLRKTMNGRWAIELNLAARRRLKERWKMRSKVHSSTHWSGRYEENQSSWNLDCGTNTLTSAASGMEWTQETKEKGMKDEECVESSILWKGKVPKRRHNVEEATVWPIYIPTTDSQHLLRVLLSAEFSGERRQKNLQTTSLDG